MNAAPRGPSPGQLFAAIVIVGAAMGCSSRTAATGEEDSTSSSTDTTTAEASSTSTSTTTTTTTETDTGAETDDGTSTAVPKFDLQEVPDAPPNQPPPDAYECCVDDTDCEDGEVCTTGLFLDFPDDGICTPLGCADPWLDCPLGFGGSATPTCIGEPPGCILDCSMGSCPDGLWCADDGQTAYCMRCAVPIG